MTTATRTRKPRAPRAYRVESWAAHLPFSLAPLVITNPRAHSQGDILVMATSKAAAVRRLDAAGFPGFKASQLAEGCGNDAVALQALGILAEDGDIVFYKQGPSGGPVALIRGDRQPEIVGSFEYVSVIGEGGHTWFVRADRTEMARAAHWMSDGFTIVQLTPAGDE